MNIHIYAQGIHTHVHTHVHTCTHTHARTSEMLCRQIKQMEQTQTNKNTNVAINGTNLQRQSFQLGLVLNGFSVIYSQPHL